MLKMDIIILAAGEGVRMHSYLPKVLHKIAGKTMLERVINVACSLNPRSVNIVLGKEANKVKQAISYFPQLNYVIQNKQLGTADAVSHALPNIDNDDASTLILYADVPLITKELLEKLLLAHDGYDFSIMTEILDNPTGYGRIVRNDNKFIIVEEKNASLEEKNIKEVNTGIILIKNKVLHNLIPKITPDDITNEYYLTSLAHIAHKDNYKVNTVLNEDNLLTKGVNNKFQLSSLERAFQLRKAKCFMDKGLNLLDYNRFDIRGNLNFGIDCIVDINVIFEGNSSLGDNVFIGANCVLKNVVIGDNVIIHPFSHLENCNIGNNTQIGPYARIRPDTYLDNNVKIGNFVEVKKSKIGANSKINHLTYVGDSYIGKDVNIGAGVVTCNYDGVNKYQTNIENNAFIGSGSMLVAPVNVGKNATIGAGSVITTNCPSDKLTLSRVKARTIDNWHRPIKKKKE